MNSGLFNMFNDCGGAIKKFAKIFMIVCLAAVVLFVVLEVADMDSYLLGSVGALISSCISFILVGVFGAPIIYGFGEIVDCVKEIRDKDK